MALLVPLLYFAFLPALIAVIMANVFAVFLPERSLRRRSLFAALCAGFLPASLPLLILLFFDSGDYGGVAVVALIGLAVITAVVIGLPVALFARRGKEARLPLAGTFE